MEELNYNKVEGGLELLTTTSFKKAEAEEWLTLETELRKLSLALTKKDRISLVFSKKRFQKLKKSILWPEDFSPLLNELTDHLSEGKNSISLISNILKIIWEKYFQALPFPGYWDYEELIKRLEKILDFVREKNFKTYFQKILDLVDNHQWSSDLRHQLEDLADIIYPNDLYQKITTIIKKLKKSQPIPIF